ncbi:hypothetical protein D9756_009868 [Leucocoprinus leucothites]|uniref:Uncharacterized protein n=1 Tax=Leucocoprinus leucothites TaxID=201217 RepID=A0A8H5CVP3_9AGAR|nr:hypothetical protein D9756_009868 [Leucoagaricus leucothites]
MFTAVMWSMLNFALGVSSHLNIIVIAFPPPVLPIPPLASMQYIAHHGTKTPPILTIWTSFDTHFQGLSNAPTRISNGVFVAMKITKYLTFYLPEYLHPHGMYAQLSDMRVPTLSSPPPPHPKECTRTSNRSFFHINRLENLSGFSSNLRSDLSHISG